MKNIFSNLFNRNKSSDVAPATTSEKTVPVPRLSKDQANVTTPLTSEELREITEDTQKILPQQLIYGVGHHVGRQRENNEDSIFAHTGIISTNSTSLAFGIYIVADGMGGHHNGELASEQTVRTMGMHLVNKVHSPLFGPDPHTPQESLQEIMQKGVHDSHAAINKHAAGGGTTLTAALIIGTQMTIAHVGDSRAYAVFLDGRMQLLTRDHSLVKRLEELGQITADEAAVHPQKSMLYRALGQGDTPEPDVFTATLPSPGYLFICSDGLWGVIEEEEIFSIIISAPNPQRACQEMIDAANAAGGPDNISAILVKLSQ